MAHLLSFDHVVNSVKSFKVIFRAPVNLPKSVWLKHISTMEAVASWIRNPVLCNPKLCVYAPGMLWATRDDLRHTKSAVTPSTPNHPHSDRSIKLQIISIAWLVVSRFYKTTCGTTSAKWYDCRTQFFRIFLLYIKLSIAYPAKNLWGSMWETTTWSPSTDVSYQYENRLWKHKGPGWTLMLC